MNDLWCSGDFGTHNGTGRPGDRGEGSLILFAVVRVQQRPNVDSLWI